MPSPAQGDRSFPWPSARRSRLRCTSSTSSASSASSATATSSTRSTSSTSNLRSTGTSSSDRAPWSRPNAVAAQLRRRRRTAGGPHGPRARRRRSCMTFRPQDDDVPVTPPAGEVGDLGLLGHGGRPYRSASSPGVFGTPGAGEPSDCPVMAGDPTARPARRARPASSGRNGPWNPPTAPPHPGAPAGP